MSGSFAVEATDPSLLERSGGGGLGADLVVLSVFSDERPLRGLAGLLDWRVAGRISRLLRGERFVGHRGERTLLPSMMAGSPARWVLIGLGEGAAFDEEVATQAGASLAAMCLGLRPDSVLVGAPADLAPSPEAGPAWMLAFVAGVVGARAEHPAALPEPPPRIRVAAPDPAVERLRAACVEGAAPSHRLAETRH
jgi:hypothetical protein